MNALPLSSRKTYHVSLSPETIQMIPCLAESEWQPASRRGKSQLEREGLVPPDAEWEMLEEGLTYVEATLAENKQLKKCGTALRRSPRRRVRQRQSMEDLLGSLVGNQVAICRIALPTSLKTPWQIRARH